MRWVVLEKMRGRIVQSTHLGHGHVKALRTYQMIKRQFYWPGMYTDVRRFVKACPQCMLNSEIRSVTPMTDHPMTDKAPRIYRLLSPKYRKPNTDTSHLNTDPAPPKYRQLPTTSGHHRDDAPGLWPRFSLGPGLGRSRAPMAGHNPTSANSTSARFLLRQVYLWSCQGPWGARGRLPVTN